jgi:hypothetical protein
MDVQVVEYREQLAVGRLASSRSRAAIELLTAAEHWSTIEDFEGTELRFLCSHKRRNPQARATLGRVQRSSSRQLSYEAAKAGQGPDLRLP